MNFFEDDPFEIEDEKENNETFNTIDVFDDAKFNEHNKRIRPELFPELMDEVGVDELAPFEHKPRYTKKVEAFSYSLSTLPGNNRKKSCRFKFSPGQYKSQKEMDKAKREYEREMYKEEIRQIMRLNKYKKSEATEKHRKIENFSRRNFNSNCFVSGREKNGVLFL